MKWDYIPKQHKNPIKAIREMCISCMGGGKPYHQIESCASTECALYAFRFGKNPYRKPPSEKQKQVRVRNLLNIPSDA